MMRSRSEAFDVVVSDYSMPQCSGLELARQVTRLRLDLPAVISSGHVTRELRADTQRNCARADPEGEHARETGAGGTARAAGRLKRGASPGRFGEAPS